jgi:alpha-beta hydrolase superfamily lysophospholipase
MVIKPRKQTEGVTPASIQLPYEQFRLQVADSLNLDTYYIPAESDTPKATLILLHGIGNNKNGWVETAAMYRKWGYASLLYDARAHGASDGTYCTLGFHEKHDVSKAIDWLETNKAADKIGIIGNSMGGAVALQALAIEPRLQFGMIECSFTDMRSVVHAYQKRYAYGLSFEGFTNENIDKAAEIAGFDPDQVCPVCDASKITQPILLFHGSKDINIDPSSMDKIYAALGSAQKEKVLVEGADHYTIMQVGGDAVRNKMREFLDGR